ncbi:MAG: hypothetical protein LRY71_17305 [Bacillaceae bacterium]|nr:hypothetical protein [Bacillaceae bacterium]
MNHYEKLYKKYLKRKERLFFAKEDVERILVKKFNAKEFPKEFLIDLKNDDQLEYDKIYKCYVIDDPKILDSLYSNQEKKEHRDEIIDNRENPLNPKKVDNWNYNHILLDEQEGRRVDIILESKDGEVITEFIVRDICEAMNKYLNALIVGSLLEKGLAEYSEDINNRYFQFYLENLDTNGFLN